MLNSAIKNADFKIAKKILTNPLSNFDSEYYNRVLKKASYVGDAEVVTFWLEKGADPRYSDDYAIRTACAQGHTNVVKILLDDGRADPACKYNLCIQTASLHGHADVVKLLLADQRVNPEDRMSRSLRLASLYRRPEVVRLLLDDGRADPHLNGARRFALPVKMKHRMLCVFYSMIEEQILPNWIT